MREHTRIYSLRSSKCGARKTYTRHHGGGTARQHEHERDPFPADNLQERSIHLNEGGGAPLTGERCPEFRI